VLHSPCACSVDNGHSGFNMPFYSNMIKQDFYVQNWSLNPKMSVKETGNLKTF